MSLESATEFVVALYTDEELKTAALGDKDVQQANLDRLAAFANERGYTVTAEDLEVSLEQYTVDSDRDL